MGTSGRQSARRVVQESLGALRRRRRGQIIRAVYPWKGVSWQCDGICVALKRLRRQMHCKKGRLQGAGWTVEAVMTAGVS